VSIDTHAESNSTDDDTINRLHECFLRLDGKNEAMIQKKLDSLGLPGVAVPVVLHDTPSHPAIHEQAGNLRLPLHAFAK
jgi:hypothetical protein